MTEHDKNITRFEVLYRKYQENMITAHELDELLELSTTVELREWIEGPLSENWAEIVSANPLPVINPSRRRRRMPVMNVLIWSSAAILVVMIAASIWFWNRDLGWEEYRTGNGETLQVLLSDQSQVLINANSSIRWNEDWEKDGERTIELSGEAFFEIARMESSPLKVKSQNATIRVLGTSFNVREDVLGTDVYLYEGSIELDFTSESVDSSEILMNSGDRVVKPANKSILEKYEGVSKSEAASWTEGELRFIDRPLEEILTRLEVIYGKQFEVEDTSILSIPMDVGLPYANWEVMKSALELSLTVKLEEEGQIVKLQNIE